MSKKLAVLFVALATIASSWMLAQPNAWAESEGSSGPMPLLRMARPAPAAAAPEVNRETASANDAPSTPAVATDSAASQPQASATPTTQAPAPREPRGILAPFFHREDRTPIMAQRSQSSIFRPRPATSRQGHPQPAEERASPAVPEATPPTPTASHTASTPRAEAITVPAEPIARDPSATLTMAQRSVAPPPVAPNPPGFFVTGPSWQPEEASVTEQTAQQETPEPQPEVEPTPAKPEETPANVPHIVKANPPTASPANIASQAQIEPTQPEPAQPEPAPVEPPTTSVAEAAPPAYVPPAVEPQPEVGPQQVGPQRVLTIDRNNPVVVSPAPTQSGVNPHVPRQNVIAPVLRPIRPAPPALPELAVFMAGENKVLHGENASVKVRVVNTGRGPARDVILDIVGNDQLLKTLPIGAVPPGRSIEVEIQLTPQVLGELELQAVAKAKEGERAVAVRSMFVGKPEITLAIAGPGTINFGEVQIYTAIIDNKGNADAEEVSLLVMLQGKEAQSLVLGNVLAGQRRRVSFELRPELGGVLSLNAVATGVGGVQAVANGSINVMQQQIELAIDGPRTLRFGEAARYTLKINNKGNTDAENVVVNVSLGESVLDGLFEGSLAVGEKKELMFEVSPSRPGNQTLTAVALTSAGTNAAATARLQVQHGQLELSAAGPGTKFSGGSATYDVKVKNVGDAPAEDVLLTAHLPTGAKYVGGVDRIEFYEGVTWRVGELPPGEQRTYQLECLLEDGGEQAIVFSASGAGELSATHKLVTNVEALADIRLYVADPQGLIAVGEEAVYEIELHNRGVKEARDIELKLLLGDALRPKATEGLSAQLNPTGVVFEKIDRLGPKETRKILVTMQAISEGSHQFRVEASAVNPETFVASEGTTRFYAKSKPIAPAAGQPIERTTRPTDAPLR